MKTVRQALLDEIYYPIGHGFVENKLIERGLDGDAEYTADVSQSDGWKGALADCLMSLVQAVTVSEADKSIGVPTDTDKEYILKRARRLYRAIGEEDEADEDTSVATVRLGWADMEDD